MTGIAHDMNLSATHFGADPIADISLDLNFSAKHFRAQMHACVAVNSYLARIHAAADLFHPAAIAFDEDDPIRGVPFDTKKISQRRRRIAVLHVQGGDRDSGLAGKIVGRDALCFDWNRRRAFVFQMEHVNRQARF
jgi:hypothetical protein